MHSLSSPFESGGRYTRALLRAAHLFAHAVLAHALFAHAARAIARRHSAGAGRAPRAGALVLLLAACARVVPATAAAPPAPAAATAGAATTLLAEDLMARAVQDSVRAVLGRALADSAFPGAYAVAGSASDVYASVGAGRIDWAQGAPAPTEHTLWDLASLTKVVGLTTAVMQLWDSSRLELDAPVSRYLPEWTGGGKERVTVRQLLTHSSGLPAWRALYREASTPAEALALVYATPLDTVPGARMLYSDLGAILLGQVVSRVTGEPLDQYLERAVFGPLGMRHTLYRLPPEQRAHAAPTELDPWRGRLVRGEVHDENAYALGGVSSHAGLFSDAADLTRFAQMYLNGGVLDSTRVISREAIATFTAVQDSTLSNRALGWETPTGHNSAGALLSSRSFGHTGFTGTSLWIDPARDLFVVLLTNRVNPSRENRRILAVRPALANAVAQAVDAVRGTAPPGPPTAPPAAGAPPYSTSPRTPTSQPTPTSPPTTTSPPTRPSSPPPAAPRP